MDLSDGIAILALVVSATALSLQLVRGRRAELVVSWDVEVDQRVTTHTGSVLNAGEALATNVEMRLLRQGVDITEDHVDGGRLHVAYIAAKNTAAVVTLIPTFGERLPDAVVLRWSDRRRGRQELTTSLGPSGQPPLDVED